MKYEYWFGNLKGISNEGKRQLREKAGSAKKLYYIEEKEAKTLGISQENLEILRVGRQNQDWETEYERSKKKGITPVYIWQKQYPKRLRQISCPPYVLSVKGSLPPDDMLTVAIVGARECSPYGQAMAQRFAEALGKAKVPVISGMARGIDAIAQKSVLKVGGTSFAVLGSGADVCYPREHMELYTNLIRQGGILSEQPIGMPPLARNFPARNRLISGLADVVLVIEAKQTSGSLITADMALDQGKDVYALPGPIYSELSRGCHNLIRQGAGIFLSPESLLEDLKIGAGFFCENQKKKENEILLERRENILYSCLSFNPKHVGDLAKETGMTISEVFDSLVELELQGFIREISKNYYVRTK